MTIRGLQTLNGNNGILLLVDGLERDNNWNALNYITRKRWNQFQYCVMLRLWLFMAIEALME